MLRDTDVNTVFNQCRVELTGVSDALLKSQLFEVLDEIFRDTSSWRTQIPFNVTPSSVAYDLVVDEGQIIRLDKVTDAGGNFVPALMADIPTAVLQHAPNTAQSYIATVVQNVSLPLDSRGLPAAPEWILQQWHLVVKHGILGNLKLQSNKSYSDAKGAVVAHRSYRNGIANLRSAVLRANTSGAQAWRFPQAFRTSNQRGGVPPVSGGERTF